MNIQFIGCRTLYRGVGIFSINYNEFIVGFVQHVIGHIDQGVSAWVFIGICIVCTSES